MTHESQEPIDFEREWSPSEDLQVGADAALVLLGEQIGGGAGQIVGACLLAPEVEPAHSPRRRGFGDLPLDLLVRHDTICRGIGISEQSYYRWRRDYGGLKLDQAKRLKDLERENDRLKKAVSELTLDKLILKEALEGKY